MGIGQHDAPESLSHELTLHTMNFDLPSDVFRWGNLSRLLGQSKAPAIFSVGVVQHEGAIKLRLSGAAGVNHPVPSLRRRSVSLESLLPDAVESQPDGI